MYTPSNFEFVQLRFAGRPGASATFQGPVQGPHNGVEPLLVLFWYDKNETGVVGIE